MTRKFILLFNFIIFFLSNTSAQDNNNNFLAGIDLTKSLGAYTHKGHHATIIEPFIMKEKNSITYYLAAGYSKYTKDSVQENTINNITKGIYIKPGIYGGWEKHLKLGANLIYSSFQEEGTFYIKGEYFGNYYQTYSRNIQYLGIEFSGFFILFYKRIGCYINARIGTPLYIKGGDNIPIEYFPGLGLNILGEPGEILSGSGGISSGIVFRLN